MKNLSGTLLSDTLPSGTLLPETVRPR